MTAALIMNIVFAAIALSAVLGVILWGVATQRRDRGGAQIPRARATRGRVPARRRGIAGALFTGNA